MKHEIDAILTGFMAGPGIVIIVIGLAVIGVHLGFFAMDAIERKYRAASETRQYRKG